MNQFIAVLFALMTLASCEPPRPTYGAPSIGSGWASTSSSGSSYVSQSIGHQTSEGAHIDDELLHKVKEVLLSSENGGSSGSLKPVYGPPSHWSDRVVGIDFGHPVQSYPVAYYLGQTYAPQETGWVVSKPWTDSISSGWTDSIATGWSQKPSVTKISTGWSKKPSTGWTDSISTGWSVEKPSAGWTDSISSGWAVEKPSVSYGVPSVSTGWIQKPSSVGWAKKPATGWTDSSSSGWAVEAPSTSYGVPKW